MGRYDIILNKPLVISEFKPDVICSICATDYTELKNILHYVLTQTYLPKNIIVWDVTGKRTDLRTDMFFQPIFEALYEKDIEIRVIFSVRWAVGTVEDHDKKDWIWYVDTLPKIEEQQITPDGRSRELETLINLWNNITSLKKPSEWGSQVPTRPSEWDTQGLVGIGSTVQTINKENV